jgi:hypothetical protein
LRENLGTKLNCHNLLRYFGRIKRGEIANPGRLSIILRHENSLPYR